MEDSENFQKMFSNSELELLKDSLEEIKDSLEILSINLVDLGCGDGRKSAFIFENLKNKFKIRYCAINLINYMVEKAIQIFSKLDVDNIIEFQYNISDFENQKPNRSKLRGNL